MKRILCLLAGALTALCWICPEVHAQQELIPVGQVVALSLEDDTVTVAGVESSATPLQLGDQLLSIDDQTIRTPQDVLDYMQSAGDTVRYAFSGTVRSRTCLSHRKRQLPESVWEFICAGVWQGWVPLPIATRAPENLPHWGMVSVTAGDSCWKWNRDQCIPPRYNR